MKKLFVSGLLAVAALTSTATIASAETYSVRLSASDCWYNTGIRVHAGDTVTFTASGRWTTGHSELMGPAGNGQFIDTAESSSAPFGSLIGKVSNGTPFLVGSHSRLAVEEAGNMYLGMNDFSGACADNSGSLNIQIDHDPEADREISETLHDLADTVSDVETTVDNVENLIDGLQNMFN